MPSLPIQRRNGYHVAFADVYAPGHRLIADAGKRALVRFRRYPGEGGGVVPTLFPPSATVCPGNVSCSAWAPLPSPDRLEVIETKAPLIKPGTATATPTAFGARWGQIYGAIGVQPVSRYATVADTDWQNGEWSDGTISLGLGVGNPRRWVGLDMTLNIFDTRPRFFGGSDQFGEMRTLSVKLHRALPHESAIALGYENAWRNSPDEDQGGNSLYGVVTKVFTLRARRNSLFSRATVSVGLGNDRFLPESQYQRQAKGVNVFGNAGVRLWSFMNVVADWTGQDLNVGVSVTPIPRVPLVLTPALVDVTGRAGDQVRFSIGATMTYDIWR